MTSVTEQEKTISELCVGLLQDCRDRLKNAESLEDEDLVHDLRVGTKKLRAVWHLVKSLAGTRNARQHRQSLRDLSAHLSFRRDVAVLDELTRQMAAAQEDGKDAMVLDRIGVSLREQPTHSVRHPCSDGLFDEVRTALIKEKDAWEAIDWTEAPGHHPRKSIRRTLRKSASKARRMTRKALADDSAEIWHEWRKAIKRLRYQREFMAEASGRIPGKFDQRVSQLGTALGERNDLANLLAYGEKLTESGDLASADLGNLKRIIAMTERDLLANCRRRGRRLFRKRS